MTRRLETHLRRLAAVAILAVPLAGCLGGEEFQRGYLIDERALGQVTRGMSAEKVLETLGTPSTVSTVGNRTWYYISQRSRRTFQFASETIVDQRVTAVYFDRGLKVERVALYGLRDGRVFDFLSRTTPTGGEDLSFIGQLFRGDTTFNPL
jgi:outer membrane protein assembly factor BamE (lipoprotein component of BamABCDE complex)